MKHRLQLTFFQSLRHYGIVFVLLFITVLFGADLVEVYITNSYTGASSGIDLLLGTACCFFLSIVFAYIQYRRLEFKEISIVYTEEEFKEAVERTRNEIGWEKEVNGRVKFRASRPSDWSGSWGEMITIIKGKNTLLINSICDPDKPSSVIAYGWNRKNVEVFLRNLNEIVNNVPAKPKEETGKVYEWAIGKILGRLLLYPISIFLIAFGAYAVLKPTNFRAASSGILAMSIAVLYLYADLKMIFSKQENSQ